MSEFAAWATGLDRPGIVAAVTGALYDQGCNLEDCSMTILSGHFAMMLLVRGPDDVSAESLEAALKEAGEPLGLSLAVREVGDEALGAEVDGDPYMVTAYGADRPGIVHQVSELLAREGVNITDLETKVLGPDDDPVYAMHLEVVVPDDVEVDSLREHLQRAARELGVDASLHPIETDLL